MKTVALVGVMGPETVCEPPVVAVRVIDENSFGSPTPIVTEEIDSALGVVLVMLNVPPATVEPGLPLPLPDDVTVTTAGVGVEIGVDVVVGVAVAIDVEVAVGVGVRVDVAVEVALAVDVEVAVGVGVAAVVVSWKAPRPWVPMKINPLLLCSISKTGTAGRVPPEVVGLTCTQLVPPLTERNTPMSVATSNVCPLTSWLSTSICRHGMSGRSPVTSVQLVPKSVVLKPWSTPVDALKPELVTYAFWELKGSGRRLSVS